MHASLKSFFDKYVGVAIANIIFNYWPRNKLAFVYSVIIRRTNYYTVETVWKSKRKIVLERETAIHIIHKCMAPSLSCCGTSKIIIQFISTSTFVVERESHLHNLDLVDLEIVFYFMPSQLSFFLYKGTFLCKHFPFLIRHPSSLVKIWSVIEERKIIL